MQAGAGRFADRVEPGERRLAGRVGQYTAAEIVGCGNDRNRITFDVDADIRARLADVREALGDRLVAVVEIGEVEVDEFVLVRRHLLDDRARHDVARREVLQNRRILFHEVLALLILQPRALAPQRLGNQIVIGLLVRECGRMELHVLGIHYARTGALRHHHAVADGVARVRGVQVDLTDAAGGEDGEVAENREDLVRPVVQQIRARAFIREAIADLDVGRMMLRRQEIDRGHLRDERDVRLVLHAIEERGLDGAAGGVAGVNDARQRVRPFLRQIELALLTDREGDVHLIEQQFLDNARPFDGEEAHRLFVREPRAGGDDVLDQLCGRVAFALVNDPALCPERVAVLRIRRFRDEEDFDPRAGQAEGRGEPGDAGADDEDGIVVAVLQRRHAAHCSGQLVASGQWSVVRRKMQMAFPGH